MKAHSINCDSKMYFPTTETWGKCNCAVSGYHHDDPSVSEAGRSAQSASAEQEMPLLASSSPTPISVAQAKAELLSVISALLKHAMRHGESAVVVIPDDYIEEVDALIDAVSASQASQLEKKKDDHGAGLIGQPIPDMAGTEPRPINVCAAWASTRQNCPEFNAVVRASASTLERAERAEAAIRRSHKASCICVFCSGAK